MTAHGLARLYPLVTAVLYVALRAVVGALADSGVPQGASAHPMDVPFSMFTFWLWALVINAQERRLASTAGRRKGSSSKRSREFMVIHIWSLATLGWVVVTALPGLPFPWGIALLSIVPPLLFLRA